MPENQPHAGTTFIARGQYGSTVFDPESLSGREFLEINICDACMLEGSAQGTVLHGVTPVPLRNDYVPWEEHDKLIWCEQCGRAAWRPHERHDGEPPW